MPTKHTEDFLDLIAGFLLLLRGIATAAIILVLLMVGGGCASTDGPPREVDYERIGSIIEEVRRSREGPEVVATPVPEPSVTPEPKEEEKPYTRKIVKYQSGFVWKPISESNGRLVALLPGGVKAERVEIRRVNGDVLLEKGTFAGDTHNGGRQHWRFSQPGAAYGDGLVLRAWFADGGFADWAIPEGGARVE